MSLFAPLENLIAPPPSQSRVAFLKAQPFAHRGLHGGQLVENSRAAFSAAMALGHGIETDVQAARGGEAIVFHDATLDRLTAASGSVASHTPAELARVLLRDTDEGIPSLSEILALVGGKVPLLIEVKVSGARVTRLCLSVRGALKDYQGPAAVMSFNPLVGAWFRQQAPGIVRGLVITEEGSRSVQGRMKRWAAMISAKPDFLAYDVRDLPSRFAAAARRRGLPVLTWTVRTADDERRASAHADRAIYEKPE